ncbi:phenol hydroxylase subunit P4 [Dactylosporangium sp. CA-092794]|uniref:phenol hydroxylase subunit P4 n=1 Tax=Dactylosporangium sp. CA-092794 TaxID=3239929 RepID=UPI003D8B43A4
MPVRAITETYEFPSRSRAELYGDDQLVHVMWKGNPLLAAAATFRVPRAMPWARFLAGVVDPWAASDPDYLPGSARSWNLDGRPLYPHDDDTLAGLDVGHKSLLAFEC